MAELLKLNFEKEFEKFKTKIELLNEKENNFEDNSLKNGTTMMSITEKA
jgi:hypothetical protein